MSTQRPILRFASHVSLVLAFLAADMMAIGPMGWAQAQPASGQTQQPTQAVPDSGGPSADTGVIAVPKKKEEPEEVASASRLPRRRR